MGRSRRVVIDGGFIFRGQDWAVEVNDVFFPGGSHHVELDLGFNVLFGQDAGSVITIWDLGFVSFGPPTAEQIAFVEAGLTPFADSSIGHAGFPGEFVAIYYRDSGSTSAEGVPLGLRASKYSFSAGLVDFEGDDIGDAFLDFNYGDVEPAAFVQFDGDQSEGNQVIFVEDGLTLIDGSLGGDAGVFLGTIEDGPNDIFEYHELDFDAISDSFTFFADTSGNDFFGSWLNDVINGSSANDRLFGLGGDDFIKAGLGNDFVDGGPGNDNLRGRQGNDILDGGPGDDIMFGNHDNDTYFVDSPGDRVFETTTANGNIDEGGVDKINTSVNFDMLARNGTQFVERLTLIGSGNINGVGNDLDNIITGNTGNNVLKGGIGLDQLDGGPGNDSMFGGPGDDTYFVDSTGDRVYETTTSASAVDTGGNDTIMSSVGVNLTARNGTQFIEKLILTGVANINGVGNDLDNIITGNTGINVLKGGIGNDRLDGGPGNDKMFGESGDDTYFVDSTGDRVYETTTPASVVDTGGFDIVFSSVTLNLAARNGTQFVERLDLTGDADINGTGNDLANNMNGNSGRNVLFGGIGDDILNGGSGNDVLRGGAGKDIHIGGTGADRFYFDDGEFGGATRGTADRIIDHDRTTGDRIMLLPVDANTTNGAGDDPFTFIGTNAFGNVAGELRYEQFNGNTYVYGDTDGDSSADFAIRLDGLHTLQAGDFIL